MEVGDQKFISLSSDDFVLSTDGLIADGLIFFSTLLLFVLRSSASSPSSSMFDAIETVEEVTSVCLPKRLDRNQPLKKNNKWLNFNVILCFFMVFKANLWKKNTKTTLLGQGTDKINI